MKLNARFVDWDEKILGFYAGSQIMN